MSAMARVVLIALLLVVASDVAKARKVSTKTTKLDAARFEVDDVFSPLQAELLKLAGLREVEYEFPNDAKMRSLARNASPKIAKVAGSASSENDRVGADNLDSEDPAFQGKYPVIFIPGLMGSQLQVKLSDRKDPPNWLCRRTNEEWSRVWMIDRLHELPELVNCWEQDVMVRWNATSKTLGPASEGIESRALPGWDGAMSLGPDNPTLQPIADWMTSTFGYKQGVDVVAQPYDWRAGPETWMKPGGVFDEMKALIEHTVDSRPGKEPIVASSISLGGPFFSLFLNRHVTQEWKDRYIHCFFSISGVMSGSVIAPYVSISGTKFGPGVPSWLKSPLDALAKSVSSVPWVFPHEDAFGKTPVVRTSARNYTASELGEALLAAGNHQQAALYQENVDSYGLEGLVPNVTTYCLTGFGVPTFGSLNYGDEDLKSGNLPKNIDMTDGDNCVTTESLRICDAFGLHQKAPVFPYHVFNQTHAGMMGDVQTITLFAEVITGTHP